MSYAKIKKAIRPYKKTASKITLHKLNRNKWYAIIVINGDAVFIGI